MDNAQKAIIIGVGLFITIIIISAVLLITNLGTDLIGGATSETATMSSALKTQLLELYDGKTYLGSQLLSQLRYYSNSNTVSIAVWNKLSAAALAAGATYEAPWCIGKHQLLFTLSEVDINGDGKLTADDLQVGGILGGRVDAGGITYTYANFADKIHVSKYYKTAIVYDEAGEILGFAVHEK